MTNQTDGSRRLLQHSLSSRACSSVSVRGGLVSTPVGIEQQHPGPPPIETGARWEPTQVRQHHHNHTTVCLTPRFVTDHAYAR